MIRRAVLALKIIPFALLLNCLNLLPSIAYAQAKQAVGNDVPLQELHLNIFLSPKFLSFAGISPSAAQGICSAFSNELREGMGPWGFGLFADDARCIASHSRGSEPAKWSLNSSNLMLWELRVDLNSDNQPTLSLCRPLAQNGEKCDASVTVPTTKMLANILSDSKIVRLVAAMLLDEAPFRAKLTPNLFGAGDMPQPEIGVLKSPSFGLPAHTEALLPFAISINESTGSFKTSLRKTVSKELLKEKNIWLLTKKRGGMAKEIFAQISAAIEVRAAEYQKRPEPEPRMEKTVGRLSRQVSKKVLEFWRRGDKFLELRGGTAFLSAKDNVVALDAEAVFSEGNFTNFWLTGSYFRANYEYKVLTRSEILGSSVSAHAALSAVLVGIGAGYQQSFAGDNAFFAYPKLEFGNMSWRSESLLKKLSPAYTDTSFSESVLPGVGVVVGYLSPESWRVQWQVRAGASNLLSSKFSTFSLDVAAYIPVPALLRAQRGEFVGTAAVQTTNVSSANFTNSPVEKFSFQPIDFVFGGGYRFSWL